MKKGKSKQEIVRYYDNKILLAQNKITLKYDAKRDIENAARDTYWSNKRDREIIRKEKKIEDEREKALKNFERLEKWHKMVAYKKKSKKIWKTKMLSVYQEYVRLTESDESWWCKCISCPIKLPWKWKIFIDWSPIYATGWHYINSQRNATAFDLDNIHTQCNWCNNKMHNWWKSWDITTANYRKNLIDLIGEERVELLESKRDDEAKKPTLVDIWQYLTHDNYEYWRAKVKELRLMKTLSS